jgi:hypothetical protein
MSLLDDALRLPKSDKKSTDTEDEIQLAIAWHNGVVSDAQAAGAIRCSVNNVAGRLARILRRSSLAQRARIEFVR